MSTSMLHPKFAFAFDFVILKVIKLEIILFGFAFFSVNGSLFFCVAMPANSRSERPLNVCLNWP